MNVLIGFLLTVSVLMVTLFTIAGDMLGTFRDITDSLDKIRTLSEDRADTSIAGPTGLSVAATSTVRVTLANDGRVALGRFSDWDVIFEIQKPPDLKISYLTYTQNASPGANQWTVGAIYLNAASSTPEIVDLGIFNPGEDMVVLANPSPSVEANTDDRVTFVTANGVTVKVMFEVVP